YDAHFGMAADASVDIHLDTVQHRHNLELLQHVLKLRRHLRMHCAYDDVLPALAAAPRFIEHAERFPDAGGVAEEDFEITLRGSSRLGLHLAEQVFRRSAAEFGGHHGS